MHFGISYPTYIRAWRDVEMAEEYGFSHAWFDDSHMCYSDIFATMALAAEHSHTSVLRTFVLCAGNRAAPVSACALSERVGSIADTSSTASSLPSAPKIGAPEQLRSICRDLKCWLL